MPAKEAIIPNMTRQPVPVVYRTPSPIVSGFSTTFRCHRRVNRLQAPQQQAIPRTPRKIDMMNLLLAVSMSCVLRGYSSQYAASNVNYSKTVMQNQALVLFRGYGRSPSPRGSLRLDPSPISKPGKAVATGTRPAHRQFRHVHPLLGVRRENAHDQNVVSVVPGARRGPA